MSCTTSSALRKSGATTVLRPGAEARTPFGTPFFTLVIDPKTDTGTFVKRPLDSRMWEEIRAWEKLQRIGKLPENMEYAAVLQENHVAGDDDDGDDAVEAPTSEFAVGGGFVVGGAGYPSYFVPDVDGPGDSKAATATVAEGDGDNDDYDDRLWPDTNSISSVFDIDYILDGFMVIDMSDATGSVFWNHRRRCRHKAVRRQGALSLWSRFLQRLRPASGVTH